LIGSKISVDLSPAEANPFTACRPFPRFRPTITPKNSNLTFVHPGPQSTAIGDVEKEKNDKNSDSKTTWNCIEGNPSCSFFQKNFRISCEIVGGLFHRKKKAKA
jgi:hypothetical protein